MKPFKEVIDGIRKAVMASEVREDLAQMGEYVEQFANTAGENIQKAIDPTLSISGKAADAAKVGDVVGKLKEDLDYISNSGMLPVYYKWTNGHVNNDGSIDTEYLKNIYTGDHTYPADTKITFTLNKYTYLRIVVFNNNAKTYDTNFQSAPIVYITKQDDRVYYEIRNEEGRIENWDDKSICSIIISTNLAKINYIKTANITEKLCLEIGDIIKGNISSYNTNNDFRRTGKYIKALPNSEFIVKLENGKYNLFEYDDNFNYIKGTLDVINERKVVLSDNTAFIKIATNSTSDVFANIKVLGNHIEYIYNDRKSKETLSFKYKVNVNKGTDVLEDSVAIKQIDFTDYYTSGLLKLPSNYSVYGEKVPVIYFSHGSADYTNINSSDFSTLYMDYINYLCDEGYAIFDCFGWTTKYSGFCQMANPTNMAAIKQGLRWVCENFNVDINRVYVTSKSLGGLQAINMCYESDFHIKACCPLAPEIDASANGFGYEAVGRKSYAKDLGFSEDANHVLDESGAKLMKDFSDDFKKYMKANVAKTLGYNPLYRNLIGFDAEELIQYQIDGDYKVGLPNKIASLARICTVPTKIFVAPDDVGLYPISKAYIQSIKNAGGVAELRTMPSETGGHHAVDNDPNSLKVDSITTQCGITHTNIPLAYVEMVDFFRRYN